MDLALARVLKARALGGLLRQHRAALGLSRPAMARTLGIAVGTLKNLELARHWPVADTVDRLAKIGVIPPDLLDALRLRPRR